MARSRKRITRRDLRQPDHFITFTSTLLRFFQQHRSRILVASALVIAALLTLWGWDTYKERQNRMAAQEYSSALAAYHNGQHDVALDALDRLSSTYRWSTYSRLALLYRAHSYIALKRPSEAIPVLQSFLTRETENSYLRQLAFLTLGYAHESAGQCQQGVTAFTQARKLDGPLQQDALLAKARCSAQSGDFSQALDSYREYLNSYPGSAEATEISLRIQEIEGKMKGG